MKKILNALFGLSEESGEATHADVIDLLKEDHQNVKDLFQEFEDLDSSQTREKRKKLKKIFEELAIHTQLEEELVYPLVEGNDELVMNAKEEHHVVDLIIAEIKKVRAMNEKTDAKVKVLKEMVEHHIEEEEKEMLPNLPQNELQEIGARVKVRKEELLGKEFPEKEMVRAGVQPVEELYGGTEAIEGDKDKAGQSAKKASSKSGARTKSAKSRRTGKKRSVA